MQADILTQPLCKEDGVNSPFLNSTCSKLADNLALTLSGNGNRF